jgi:hypothetical protein
VTEQTKYSAEWVRQQAAGKTRLDHHDCGGCGYMTAYLFDGDNVYFDPGCHCSSYGPSPFEPCSFKDIANWLAMQSTDEVRDRIMSRLNSEATPA